MSMPPAATMCLYAALAKRGGWTPDDFGRALANAFGNDGTHLSRLRAGGTGHEPSEGERAR